MDKRFRLNVDINKLAYNSKISVKQYDTVTLDLSITDMGVPIDISNMSVRVNILTPTKALYQTEKITITDIRKGKLIIELLNSAFADAGECKIDLTFINRSLNKNITTVTLYFNVEKALYSDEALMNSFEKDAVQKVLEGTDILDQAKELVIILKPLVEDGNTLKENLKFNIKEGQTLKTDLENLKMMQSNRRYIISKTNWGKQDPKTWEYSYVLEHDLKSVDLHVQAYKNGKNTTIGFTPIDNTHIKFTSDDNEEHIVILSVGYYGGYTSPKIEEQINKITERIDNLLDCGMF